MAKKQNSELAVFSRMWHLLNALETEPRFKTVRELSKSLEEARLEATDRTLQRILKFFELEFGLTGRARQQDRGHPYEWAWPSTTGRPTMGAMDPATAITYELAANLVSSVLPSSILKSLEPDFRRARKVLGQSGATANTLSKKVRILPRGGGRLPAEIRPQVLANIYSALMRNRKVYATYQSASAEAGSVKDYEISPLGILTRFDTLYLVHIVEKEGSNHAKNEPMAWPLHRFKSIFIIEDEQARTPSGFDLETYSRSLDFLDNPQTMALKKAGDSFTLKILAQPHTALYIKERPFGTDQSIKQARDGRVRIEATVRNTRELLTQLHDFGADIEVLSPKVYRDYFKELANKLSAQYS